MKSLEDILTNRICKDEMIAFVEQHPDQFKNLVEIAITKDEQKAWRAAWLLSGCMLKNDKRIRPHAKNLIEAICDKKDGHQRELLKVLSKIEVTEDLESLLFDTCIVIWKTIAKSPSVRIVAFRLLLKIAQKYPELQNEIQLLSEDYYTETLTPGVKASFNKLKI